MFIKIFLVAIFEKRKQKKSKINLNIFYLIQYIQNIMVSYEINTKFLRQFTFFSPYYVL